jgi:chromosome segregation ATPase
MIIAGNSCDHRNTLEKKQRVFDKTVQEWQGKCNDMQRELENSQKESRGYSAELFRTKAQFEESGDAIESLRRENKNLAGENCLLKQI